MARLYSTIRINYTTTSFTGKVSRSEKGEEEENKRCLDMTIKLEYEELREALADLMVLFKTHESDVLQCGRVYKWGTIWVAAAIKRVQRALRGLIDRQQAMLQTAAEMIGNSI